MFIEMHTSSKVGAALLLAFRDTCVYVPLIGGEVGTLSFFNEPFSTNALAFMNENFFTCCCLSLFVYGCWISSMAHLTMRSH